MRERWPWSRMGQGACPVQDAWFVFWAVPLGARGRNARKVLENRRQRRVSGREKRRRNREKQEQEKRPC